MGEYDDLVYKNEILEVIFDNTHFCVVMLDKDFNFIQVNQAYADTCKKKKDFFTGKNHFKLYPHEENEKIFKNVVRTGEPFTIFSKPFDFPDDPGRGTTYWDWTLNPLKNSNGEVHRLLFTLVDVTEKTLGKLELEEYKTELEVQVETSTAELRESEKRYRFSYENTPVMMHSINKEGKIIAVSTSWLEKLGYNRDEVIGRYLTDFLNEESKVYAKYAVMPDFFSTGTCKDVEYTFVKKSGETINVLLSANSEKDSHGQIIRSLAVLQDITRQKEVDSYREKLIKKLQESISEINNLRKIIPICSFCKNIRNEDGNYEQIESYIHKHSDIDFSHTVCPSCMKIHYPKEYEIITKKNKIKE